MTKKQNFYSFVLSIKVDRVGVGNSAWRVIMVVLGVMQMSYKLWQKMSKHKLWAIGRNITSNAVSVSDDQRPVLMILMIAYTHPCHLVGNKGLQQVVPLLGHTVFYAFSELWNLKVFLH